MPVVVDAAYLSFPLSELERWASAADVACFSAKYFWGPNGGGFVAGRAGSVADVAALDFTGYESGRWRTFGRAFKLDRATVVATVAALEEWLALDHDARLAGYAALAEALAARCARAAGRARGAASSSRSTSGWSTVRSTRCSCAAGPRGAGGGARRAATRASGRWPTATRSCSAPRPLRAGEVDEIVAALAARLAKPGRWLSVWPLWPVRTFVR